ncbi:MAG: hypothetical protein AB7G93_13725 [Bdellovibrionales bacterium]
MPDDLPGHSQNEPTIGICKDLGADKMVGIASEYGIWHLVHETPPHYESDVKTAEIMLTQLETFLKYPASSILTPETAGTEQEQKLLSFDKQFSCADQKLETVEGLESHLLNWKRSKHFKSEVLLAADELFTNAIYNAPYVGDSQNPTSVPRTKEYGNNPDIRPARIFLACDGTRLLIGCEDSYGSLNIDTLIERLKVCLQQGAEAAIRWTDGGAGLGTYMILRSALAYYVGVLEGKKTVVCCTYPLTHSRMEMVRNLHFARDKEVGKP